MFYNSTLTIQLLSLELEIPENYVIKRYFQLNIFQKGCVNEDKLSEAELLGLILLSLVVMFSYHGFR